MDIPEVPKQDNMLPLCEVANGEMGTFRAHVPSPMSDLFSPNPSRFVPSLGPRYSL